ncbi:MAG: protein kinase domain-containing protein [Anaerolineae bacterium]
MASRTEVYSYMSQPLAIGTILKNRYRVVRLVGGGGMAWVYQVEELPAGSGILWALKELRPQTQDRAEQATAHELFDQEARLLRDLDHVNIPKIADFFKEAGRACLVMEFVWGESLEKRLTATNAPLLETDVLKWAVQLCEALDYLHTRQPPIIFRDMKPSNVMVTNTSLVKLIDFGIARTYKVGKKRDTVAMGSENYAAPEQWGKGQTDARSDLYGLGATMYHLLANMAPTPAFLPSEPLPLANYNSALSPETIAIVEKAMARDRLKRFQSAPEMRQALLDALPAPYVAPVAPAPPPAAGRTAPDAARPKQQPAPQPVRAAAQPEPAAPSPARPVPQPVSRKACPSCGRSNIETARFCVGCGYALVPPGRAILRIVEPVRAAWEMPVSHNPMLLGRASDAEAYRPDFDMTFYDEGDHVSRRHARITRGRGGYFITDLASSNGTTVNGYPLLPHRAYQLRNGDRIQVGKVVIQFWWRW